MRKILVLIVSLALFGACKSGGGDDQPATTAGGGIRDKVLTVADLPPGFTRTSLDVDKRELNPIGCTALDSVDEQYLKTTEHTIEAAFENGDAATQHLDEAIYTFETVDEANAYFDANVAGFNTCKTFSSKDADGTTTGQIQPYTFPAVGEESYAASVTVSTVSADGTNSIAGSLVFLRKGNIFMGFTAAHSGNQPGLTGAEVEAIVRKGADKL